MESPSRAIMDGDIGESTYDQCDLRLVLCIFRKENGELTVKLKPRKEERGPERGRQQRGDGGIDQIKACETGTKRGQGQQQPMKEKISTELTSAETALFLAKLDVAAAEDVDLHRASRPAIEKLKMLPKLQKVLAKRQLQDEFLDRGVLSSLKKWLELLPDGSLPDIAIRSALLKLLTDLPIHVEVVEISEELKKSGLGKAVMFYASLRGETPANKKLARDLTVKWSCPILETTTEYEVKKPVPKPRVENRKSRINKTLQLMRRKKTQKLRSSCTIECVWKVGA